MAVLSKAYTAQQRLDAYSATAIPAFDFSDQAMRSTSRRAYIYLETVTVNEQALMAAYTAALRVLGVPAEVRSP